MKRDDGLSLADKVQYLPGVGPRRAVLLDRLGVRTVGDLLEYLPVRHERNECRTVENLDMDEVATVVGQVTALNRRLRGSGPTVSATLTDNTGRCSLRWFNIHHGLDRLRPGDVIRATGKVRE
jgi:ATP-dependent DNA helicase RecG